MESFGESKQSIFCRFSSTESLSDDFWFSIGASDSFGNVVDLLDDMFERAAVADDEPCELNFVKKHALELSSDGVERPAARLFSNPPGKQKWYNIY